MLALTTAVRSIASFYPPRFRAEIERDIPRLMLQAGALAWEVMRAEEDGIRYAEAVHRPEFPLMGRVHYGLADMLQWRLTPELREALQELARHAERGEFDDARRLLFIIAFRRRDPEAAIARFLLFEGVCLNLLLATWDRPDVEAIGALAEVVAEAQTVVDELLGHPAMYEDDVRPLHVLVAEMVIHLEQRHARRVAALRNQMGEFLQDLVEQVEATRLVRSLDASDAAVFRPGPFPESFGSQQIADRYPWHFPSANAVEKRRSRLRARLRRQDWLVDPRRDRVVDVLLGGDRKGGAE
jgi:hypothetical protein